MRIKQLCVFLENKKGHLVNIAEIITEADIEILALSLADTAEFGILRVIVKDPAKAEKVLRERNVVCRVNEVTAVELDRTGELARLLRVVGSAGVNVEYMYALTEVDHGKVVYVFRFDSPDTAVEALRQAGMNVLARVDLGIPDA